MIYKEVTFEEFEKAFMDLDRQNHFPNTLRHLFDYLNGVDEDGSIVICDAIKLDVISLCCEFTENTIYELMENFGNDNLCKDNAQKFIEDLNNFMKLNNFINVIDCKNGYYLVIE